MKKLTAIFFLMLFTAGTTQFCELVKIPLLFSHFKEHQANRRTGIGDFLINHYLKEKAKKNKNDKDLSLPFKSLANQGGINMLFTPCLREEMCTKQLPCLKNQNNKIYTSSLPAISLSGIWQPPKQIS